MALITIPALDDAEAVLFPFHPEAPVSEVLEWKTDVILSHNGTEDRQRIRKAPRQAFSLRVPIPSQLNPRAFNTAYGGRAERYWAVPVWTEAQAVGAVSFGATSLMLDTTLRDYRDGTLALVWQSPEKWRAVAIDTVSPTELTLTAEVGETFQNALVMPLRYGRLRGNVQRRSDGFRTSATLRLEAEDNRDLEPPAPAQFEGHDIYFDENIMSREGVTEDITARVEVLDFEAGKVTQYSHWNYNRRSKPYRRVLEGPEEVWAFREWLHRRAGKLRAFWLPSFEHDLWVDQTGPVTDTLLFRADGYAELGLDASRTHIAIQEFDGTWHARTITEVTPSGNFLAATLDSPLVDVDSGAIQRVSFLGLHRLDTDRAELRWQGGGVCVCEVRILEVSP